MSHCFTQLHLQIVFAVKYRAALIAPGFRQDLYQYMAGIINNRSHSCLIINGISDHVHILVRMSPAESIASLTQTIKCNSSRWINDHQPLPRIFRWQEGYGAFSYSKSHVPKVVRYIENQEQHHRQRTFQEEYQNMINRYKNHTETPHPFLPLI
ncbi:IS200/IS605 family transposase [Chitinophaga oryzae]|uniref:IS200/IS605 family transposase n=1 Tax=Chitinophaga oryzae TaxID=2725414 RepID=A0AAE6ZIM9_9BACT|nr:IS200/IS605 family transposase [Chitinophaga oryzae]QJB32592.1 IS200/IS605 family transposase [Chitinophaga oryzae]